MKPEEIRELRKDSGLTKLKFAQLLGVSPTTITYWETGERNPPQLYMANMMKLRQKLDGAQNKDEVTEVLMTFLLAGGIIAFLTWLFSKDE